MTTININPIKLTIIYVKSQYGTTNDTSGQ